MMKRKTLLFFLISVLALLPCVYGFIFVQGGAGTSAPSNQKFYSDYNDDTDDAQWATLPTGWDDDYATSPAPLEGTQSLDADTNDGYSSDAFTAVSGTVYARYAFRNIANHGSTGPAVILSLLDASDNQLAKAELRWTTDSNTYYRLYAYDDGTNNGKTIPITSSAFNDATYYLYLTYNPSTSITAEVKDATGTLVDGYSITINTVVTSANVSKVRIERNQSGDVIFDKVEVRTDTNWGS